MELITPDILKKVLVQSGESDDVECILSSESEEQGGFGENYCSNILRIHLKLKLTSGKIFKKTLLLKIFLENLDDVPRNEMKRFFSNEVTMYNEILIHLGNLAEKYNLNHSRVWPNCYFASTDVFIFDDLKEAGFVVAPRHKGLTLEESHQVIRFLGRLHALSVSAERRKLINPLLIRKTYTWVQLENFTYEFVKKGIYTTGKLVTQWGNEWEDAGRRIMDYSEKVAKILNDLHNEDVSLKVVNHGDAWINNIMVKYNDNNHVETVRFVDFQNATYGSVGWDLVYFLYTSLQGKLMRSNYDKLLTSYRDEFVDTLQRLGEDTSLAPTMDEIKADIVRLHPFCLTISCTVQPIVFNISEIPIKVDDLLNDDKLRTIYTSDVWKSTMKEHVKYLLQHNVF